MILLVLMACLKILKEAIFPLVCLTEHKAIPLWRTSFTHPAAHPMATVMEGRLFRGSTRELIPHLLFLAPPGLGLFRCCALTFSSRIHSPGLLLVLPTIRVLGKKSTTVPFYLTSFAAKISHNRKKNSIIYLKFTWFVALKNLTSSWIKCQGRIRY